MKKIGCYFLVGLVAAVVGIIFFELCADIFDGMPYGTGVVQGACAYLCIVIITCTGIIVSKLDNKTKAEDKEDKHPQ